MINNHQHIYIEKGGKMVAAPFIIESNALIFQMAEMLAEATGKAHVLNENFALDGMLPDGNRVTIIMPPASLNCPSISIRRFTKEVVSLTRMVEQNQMTPQMAMFLKTAVKYRANILISGNTSSGKTTLLNALTEHIGSNERLVTIEDTPELKVQQDNVVRLEINELAEKKGAGISTARDLLRATLRMRPDRIIMGEIRGPEAFDLLQAINTGHKGSMATIHANTPRETLSRLEHMVGMAAGAEVAIQHIRHHIASSLNLVIQTYRNHEGVRRVTHITEIIGMEGEVFLTQDHFTYKRDVKGNLGYHWAHVNSRTPCIKDALEAAGTVKDL
jgi:pilus assembly protein CpaF